MRHYFLYLITSLMLCAGLSGCERMEIPVYDEAETEKEENDTLPEMGEDDIRDGSNYAPYTVTQVQSIGEEYGKLEDVWIEGHIVGWISGSHYTQGARFEAISAGYTNILLADSIYERDPNRCIPVQLPNNSTIRQEINLQDNPSNLRRHVRLKGDITSYFNVTGLKGTSEFEWTSASAMESEELARSVINLYEDFSKYKVGDTLSLENWHIFTRYQPNHWFVGGSTYERYAGICHTDTFTDRPYECWLVTPPINLSRMKNPHISFSTAYDNWDGKAKLDVFIFRPQEPSLSDVLPYVDAPIANPSQCEARQWLPSGEIELHSHIGIRYIGFRYKGRSTGKDGTTFFIDNIRVRDKK